MRRFIDIVERVCQTPGAIYDTEISGDTIGVEVKLPKQVRVGDMSDEDGQRFDDMIHDAMERIVAKIVAKTNSDAPSLWAMARKKDSEIVTEARRPRGTTNFWFEDGFPDATRAFIVKNAPFSVQSLECQEEAVWWGRALYQAGFDVAIIGGFFETETYTKGEPNSDPSEMNHAWVTVDGKIFDPTARQFPDFRYGFIEEGKYFEQVTYEGEDVMSVSGCFM